MSHLKKMPGVFGLHYTPSSYEQVMNPGMKEFVGTEAQYRELIPLAIRSAARNADASYRLFFEEPEKSKALMGQSREQVRLAAKLTAGLPEEMREEFFRDAVAAAGSERASIRNVVQGVRQEMTRYQGKVSAVVSDSRGISA